MVKFGFTPKRLRMSNQCRFHAHVKAVNAVEAAAEAWVYSTPFTTVQEGLSGSPPLMLDQGFIRPGRKP